MSTIRPLSLFTMALLLKALGVESEMDMEGGGKSIAMSYPSVFDTKNTWSALLIPISP